MSHFQGPYEIANFLVLSFQGFTFFVLSTTYGTYYQFAEAENARIRELLCIGSEFDGYIDPVAGYATVMEFEKLEGPGGDHCRICARRISGSFLYPKAPALLARDIMMVIGIRFFDRNFG